MAHRSLQVTLVNENGSLVHEVDWESNRESAEQAELLVGNPTYPGNYRLMSLDRPAV